MHTVVLGWFGLSAVWFLPLVWRLVKFALPGGEGLAGLRSIRLWAGFGAVLAASCTLGALLAGDAGTGNALGHALARGLGGVLGRIGTPCAMAALGGVGLVGLFGFGWRDLSVWLNPGLGIRVPGGTPRSDDDMPAEPRRAARAAERDSYAATAHTPFGGTHHAGSNPGMIGAPPQQPRGNRYTRPTPWQPPARKPETKRDAGLPPQPQWSAATSRPAAAKPNAAQRPATAQPIPAAALRPLGSTAATQSSHPLTRSLDRAVSSGIAANFNRPFTQPLTQRVDQAAGHPARAAGQGAAGAQSGTSPSRPINTLNRPGAQPVNRPVTRSPSPAIKQLQRSWSPAPTRYAGSAGTAQPGHEPARPGTSETAANARHNGATPASPPDFLHALRAIEANTAQWTALGGTGSTAVGGAVAASTAGAAGIVGAAGAIAAAGLPGAVEAAVTEAVAPGEAAPAANVPAAGTIATSATSFAMPQTQTQPESEAAAADRTEIRSTGAVDRAAAPFHAASDTAAHTAPQAAAVVPSAIEPVASAVPDASAPAVVSPQWGAYDTDTDAGHPLPSIAPNSAAATAEPVPAAVTQAAVPSSLALHGLPALATVVGGAAADARPVAAMAVSAREAMQAAGDATPSSLPDVSAAAPAASVQAVTPPTTSPLTGEAAPWAAQDAAAPVNETAPVSAAAQATSIDQASAAVSAPASASTPISIPAPTPSIVAPSALSTPPVVAATPSALAPGATLPSAFSVNAPPHAGHASRVIPVSAPVTAPEPAPASSPSPATLSVLSTGAAGTAAAAPSPAPQPAPRPVPPNAMTFEALVATPVDLPPLDLLEPASDGVEPISDAQLAQTSQVIEQRLQEFKVPVTVVGASAGPVITRFEIEPALGVRGSQIVGLMKDLSRGLGLTSIRVVETIPGKTCMGLELPNAKRQIIRLSEILASRQYQHSASQLTIAMGKDIVGNPVVTDLAKAPHMLVAGTTGSGKSVAINAMILSLLYKAAPEDVRLIMIDPKMLELSVYEGIPHLLAPVVTDMKLAANALNWCVGEMEKRYRLMSAVGVRNLAGFNQKIRDAEAQGRKIGNPFSLTPDAPEPLATLPMIVVVIDELADLMMVAGKKIEELIARLAQKARAAGIHLILATQRPSVDVITGLIKANIPTRVAFQVSSKIDSRTILDQMGAESLLGQGDMLFLPPGTGYPQRVHGAFVADEEVHRVVEYLKQFGEPEYVDGILDGPAGDGVAQDLFGESPDAEADPLYDEAVAFVLRSRRASISSVQRQLRIGYNRAARLVEQMEAAGLVSPMGTNGNREVLAPPLPE